MVFLSATFTLLSRLVGDVAEKTVGWSVILLFGRVPQARKRLLSFLGLAAIAWLLAIAILLVPLASTVATSTARQVWAVRVDWIHLAALVVALLLPGVVGAAMTLLSPEDAGHGPRDRMEHVLRGYPFTAVLALTIVFLAAWGIVRAVRSARRGWDSVHLPMIVKPDGYEAVVADVGAALASAQIRVARKPASPWFVVPPHLLALAGGGAMEGMVPDRLIGFEGDQLGLLVYPSDVAIIGQGMLVARARDAVARRLADSEVYLTTARESQQIEDRLHALRHGAGRGSEDFGPIDASLAPLVIPNDEWETLLRLRFQAEHDLLLAERGLDARGAMEGTR